MSEFNKWALGSTKHVVVCRAAFKYACHELHDLNSKKYSYGKQMNSKYSYGKHEPANSIICWNAAGKSFVIFDAFIPIFSYSESTQM